MKLKIVWRALIALPLAIVLLGLLAPFLSANRFRERVREALQSSLNRKVEIGEIHFNLFTGPGFSVEDVLISDDSAAGLEPFAHVDSLKARLQLTSLFTRRLAFSKLRLVEPSVNLVKTGAGPWNIRAFFQRAATEAGHGPHAAIPDIQIVDGRINVKFGLVKSVFYIAHADVDIYPNSSGDLVVDFSGEPARTDRAAQGLGRFSGRGLLHNPGNREDELNMAVQFERSSLSEVVRLFDTRDVGVHGHIASSATLSGPLSHVAIAGTLNVTDLHRWDLMPAQGEGWKLNYRGTLDLRNQRLDIDTTAAPEEKIPVALRFRAWDFVTAPKWTASMLLKDLPASSLVGTARHFGVVVPEKVQVDGKVNGAIGYSNPGGLQGELGITNVAIKLTDTAPALMENADVLVNDQQVALTATDLKLDNGHIARIEGRYDFGTRDLAVDVTTKLFSMDDLASTPVGIPVLADCRQGTWSGTIHFEQKGDLAGRWSGNVDVQNAQLDLPGIAAPLRITAAAIEVDDRVQVKNLRGRLGTIPIQGDYRFDLAGGPQTMRLNAGDTDLATLERLFMPTLRRKQGLLANLRLQRAPIPDWLKDRNVEGTLQIRRLTRDDAPICGFKARIAWTGTDVALTNATCVQGVMQASGRVAVNIAGAVPQYRLTGQVQNFDYHEGTLDFEGHLDTSGTGTGLMLNARSEGTFEGHDVQLSAEAALHDISGLFQLTGGAIVPKLSLTKIQASDSVDTFTGQGSSYTDGRLVLELTTPQKKQVKLTGSLLPLHSSAPEPRP